jgi:hypothetical protein
LFFGEGNQEKRAGQVAETFDGCDEVGQILSFIESQSSRALLRPK